MHPHPWLSDPGTADGIIRMTCETSCLSCFCKEYFKKSWAVPSVYHKVFVTLFCVWEPSFLLRLSSHFFYVSGPKGHQPKADGPIN